MRQVLSLTLIGLWLTAAFAAPAEARLKALVVGVSRYEDPRLGGSALPGAAADAEAIAAALAARGAAPADLDLLTGEGARSAAILAALDRLAASASPGDRIVLYLSGHGAQVPAAPGDPEEADGLDEVFLAADASAWDVKARRLPGSVRDDEFGRRIDAMRARGASVWFIVDACNGGGLQRGGNGGARPRVIDAQALGLPAAQRGGRADSSGLADAQPVPGGGKLVTFYAAAPGAVAWERPLQGSGGPAQRGVFTVSLLDALGKIRPDADYITLADGMEQARLSFGPPSTAPLIGGDLAERVLFDGSARDLLTYARHAPPLSTEARLAVGAPDRGCDGADPDPQQLAPAAASLRLSGCRKILVELRSTGAALGVRPWYRQADGSYVALADAGGLRLPAGGTVRFGFTFTDHDPVSGAALPSGPEYLIMLAEGGGGAMVIPVGPAP